MAYQYDIEATTSFLTDISEEYKYFLGLDVSWHSPVSGTKQSSWIKLLDYPGDKGLDFYNEGFRIMSNPEDIKRRAANAIASDLRRELGNGGELLPLDVARANFNELVNKEQKFSLYIDLGLQNQTGNK